MSTDVEYGSPSGTPRGLSFRSPAHTVYSVPSIPPQLGAGALLDRASRQDAIVAVVSNLAKGVMNQDDLRDWTEDIDKSWFNEGNQFRFPGAGSLPYAVTNYASLTDEQDISTHVSINHRCWGANVNIGGQRFMLAEGARLLRADTSTGAPTAVSCNVASAGASVTLPGNVTAAGVLNVNGTLAYCLALDGGADIIYTTDVTASPIVFSQLVALDSGDYVYAMRYIPTVGNGFNVLFGKVNGINEFHYMETTEAAPWTPKAIVNAQDPDDLPSYTPATTDALSFSTAASSGTGQPWTSASNATASDGSYATNALTLGQISQYLRLSGITDPNIPDGNRILGVLVSIEHKASIASRAVLYEVALAVNGVQVGASSFPETLINNTTDETFVFGSQADTLFASISGLQATQLEVWLRYGSGGGNVTVSVDNVSVKLVSAAGAAQKQSLIDQVPVSVDLDSVAVTGETISWANAPAVLTGGDSVYATATATAAADKTDLLLIGPILPKGRTPANAVLTGLQLHLSAKIADSSDDVQDLIVQLWRSGALVGINKAKISQPWGLGQDVELVDRTYGRDGDGWGVAGLDFDDLADTYFGIQVVLSASGDTAQIDEATVSISWTLPGTAGAGGSGSGSGGVSSGAGALPLGGFMINRNPAKPDRITIVAPVADETTTILGARELWDVDLTYDVSGNRPTFTLSQANEGMPSVWHATPYLGGTALTGGKAGEPGVFLKHITSSGELLDYSFPQSYGGYDARVNRLTVKGDWLVLEVVLYTAGTSTVVDLQNWFFRGRLYHADTLLQSKSNALAIAAAPLAWATSEDYDALDYHYVIFPSSTHTAVRQEHVQPDLSADYRVVNAGWVKSMGYSAGSESVALKTTGPRLTGGPPEALKVITVLRYLDRRISAASGASYGSVTWDIDTGGDTTLATPEITHEFTSAFEEYNVPSGGVAYKDFIWRVGLKHDAGTAETPNALPLEIETQQRWPAQAYVDVVIDPESVDDWYLFVARQKALEESKLTQELRISNLKQDNTSSTSLGALAVCEGFPDGQPQIETTTLGQTVRFVVPGSGLQVERPVLRFRLVGGTV